MALENKIIKVCDWKIRGDFARGAAIEKRYEG
jgi:hypothetical protein